MIEKNIFRICDIIEVQFGFCLIFNYFLSLNYFRGFEEVPSILVKFKTLAGTEEIVFQRTTALFVIARKWTIPETIAKQVKSKETL